MKSYLFALLINITVLSFVKSCNEFGDFCDAGDGEFPELESDHNSLTNIMDRRMRTRHGSIFFKIRTAGGKRKFIFVGGMSFFLREPSCKLNFYCHIETLFMTLFHKSSLFHTLF